MPVALTGELISYPPAFASIARVRLNPATITGHLMRHSPWPVTLNPYAVNRPLSLYPSPLEFIREHWIPVAITRYLIRYPPALPSLKKRANLIAIRETPDPEKSYCHLILYPAALGPMKGTLKPQFNNWPPNLASSGRRLSRGYHLHLIEITGHFMSRPVPRSYAVTGRDSFASYIMLYAKVNWVKGLKLSVQGDKFWVKRARFWR